MSGCRPLIVRTDDELTNCIGTTRSKGLCGWETLRMMGGRRRCLRDGSIPMMHEDIDD
jgi:hypothetical protein